MSARHVSLPGSHAAHGNGAAHRLVDAAHQLGVPMRRMGTRETRETREKYFLKKTLKFFRIGFDKYCKGKPVLTGEHSLIDLNR